MPRTFVALLSLIAGCGPSADCDPDAPGEQALAELWADADADGYTAAEPESVCVGDTTPEGWQAAAGEPDCDDTSATVHATAPDIVGDGIDQDCDGQDAIGDVTAEVVYVDAGDPGCQDETPGTQESPNCSVGHASVLTSPGGTLYVAGGAHPWWFLQAGRTYLGGRNPTDWTRDPENPTVIVARQYLGTALSFEGEGDGFDTVVEGFHAVGDSHLETSYNYAASWVGPGTLVLREVHLDGAGHPAAIASTGLSARGGVVVVEDSIIEGGRSRQCYGIEGWSNTTVSNSTITGCADVNTSRMIAFLGGDVILEDVLVAPGEGAADTVGVHLSAGRAFLSAVTVRAIGSHDAAAVSIVGAEARAEIKESALSAASTTEGSAVSALVVDDGATVIAANSAFATPDASTPAVDIGTGAVTLVNSQLMGASVALRVSGLASVELVNDNLWGLALEALLDGAGDDITSIDELNGCGWQGCVGAQSNTSHDPGYLDLEGGSFEVRPDSPLVDLGVDPSPYGLIVDRDIVGNPSPSDGDGDGRAVWDVGPHER